MNTEVKRLFIEHNESIYNYNMTENKVIEYEIAEDLSKDMTKTVLPVTLLIAVEVLFGTLGNIFILIVYYKWYKNSSFRCFVLYMAFIDLTSALTTLPGEIVSQTNWYSFPSNALCKAKSFFNVFTVWSTGLLLFLLSYDRYRKVCHPLLWQIPVTTSAKLCFACVMFAILMSSPTAVFWGIQSYDYIEGNYSVRVKICEKADSYAHDLVPFVYMLCAFVTPMFFIMLTTAILNICTGKHLLSGLWQDNRCIKSKCDNEYQSGMLDKDEVTFQFSSSCVGNDHSFTRNTLQRRFSFPAGKSTLRRKLLFDRLAKCRKSGRQLETISETKLGLTSTKEQSQAMAFLKRRENKFYSDSDASYYQQSSKTLEICQIKDLKSRHSTRRKKTLIMLILSAVFIVTMSIYLGLVCTVANTEGVLKSLTKLQIVKFFFFWRLYFINTLINPFLYGIMDQRFRKGLVRLFCSKDYYFRKYNTRVFR